MDKSEKRAHEPNRARNDVLECWYATYRNDLLRYWISKMSQPRAEELVQEIFSRLLKVQDAHLIHSPRAYLFKVGHNVLIEWHKQAQRLPSTNAEPELLANAVSTDANPPEHQHQIEQVQRALARLPPTLRAAVMLHSKHGLTYDQIAEHLNVSKRMVKRYIRKGYILLRIWLVDGAEDET